MVRALKDASRRVAADLWYRTRGPGAHGRGRVLVLAYHRVLSERELSGGYVQPGMYVRSDVFAAQMEYVKTNFEILPLKRAVELWRQRGLDQSGHYCVVTFDDGWIDNYRHAYPVLRRLGIEATIFLVTDLVGSDEWFWPDRLVYLLEQRRLRTRVDTSSHSDWSSEIEETIERWKRLPRERIERALRDLSDEVTVPWPRERLVVNWEEVAEMSQNGISFGSHSCTHPILTRETADTVRREVQASLLALREREVNLAPIFCYPNGDYTRAIVECVKDAGYIGAVSGDVGHEGTVVGDLFRIRRVGVHQDVSHTASLFAFHIAGAGRWRHRDDGHGDRERASGG